MSSISRGLWSIVPIALLLAGSTGSETSLCNWTLAAANASGIFPIEGPFMLNSNAQDPYWSLAVDQSNDTTWTSIWYNTHGQNYSDDLALNYDVCAFVISGLPANTVRLGQNDPGDCSSTLSPACINALVTESANTALMLSTYASPSYGSIQSNLSAGVLPYICSQVLASLANKDPKSDSMWPSECTTEFGVVPLSDLGPDVLDTSLTGYNASYVPNNDCSMTAASFNGSFNEITTFSAPGDEASYDNATREIYPIMTVFMPVANAERRTYTNWANTSLTCARVQNFASGSRVSPALPAGTPYSNGNGLTTGAKAGIAVGVIVGAALIVTVLFCFWRRRKQNRAVSKPLDKEKESKLPEADGVALGEVHGTDRKPELDGGLVAELGGYEKKPELHGSSVPEMPG